MALAYSTTGNTEILQIADAVAREKSIGREHVIEALENAIQVAGRRKYGHEHNIRAEKWWKSWKTSGRR
jgi:N utilization substance protein A